MKHITAFHIENRTITTCQGDSIKVRTRKNITSSSLQRIYHLTFKYNTVLAWLTKNTTYVIIKRG